MLALPGTAETEECSMVAPVCPGWSSVLRVRFDTDGFAGNLMFQRFFPELAGAGSSALQVVKKPRAEDATRLQSREENEFHGLRIGILSQGRDPSRCGR